MKKSILILSVIFMLYSCQKGTNNPPSSNSSKYYFYCVVGKDTINLAENSPVGGLPVFSFSGQVSTTISLQAQESQCSNSGQICFTLGCSLLQQKIGTYDPDVFVIEITKGNGGYDYQYLSSEHINSTKMILSVTTIQLPTLDSSGETVIGLLVGNFSGTIYDKENNVNVPISGKFSMPTGS